jgi:hypothetical protein
MAALFSGIVDMCNESASIAVRDMGKYEIYVETGSRELLKTEVGTRELCSRELLKTETGPRELLSKELLR